MPAGVGCQHQDAARRDVQDPPSAIHDSARPGDRVSDYSRVIKLRAIGGQTDRPPDRRLSRRNRTTFNGAVRANVTPPVATALSRRPPFAGRWLQRTRNRQRSTAPSSSVAAMSSRPAPNLPPAARAAFAPPESGHRRVARAAFRQSAPALSPSCRRNGRGAARACRTRNG